MKHLEPLWALCAGALIPVMAVLSGGVARATGKPVTTVTMIFAVGLAASSALSVGFRQLDPIVFATAPVRLIAGGIIVTFYLVSVTKLVPRFGAGNTILFVMTAQVLSSSAIDHFGLFGSSQLSMSSWRVSGIAFIIAGLVQTQMKT